MAGKVNNKGGGNGGANKAAKPAPAPKQAQAAKQAGGPGKAAGAAKAGGGAKAGEGAGKPKLSQDERKAFGVKGNASAMKLDDKAFGRLDKNNDGELTGKEIRKRHADWDRNGDGVVAKEEFKLGRAGIRTNVQMKQLDRNKDGILTGKERHKSITAADENGDGRIGKNELKRFHQKSVDFGQRFDAFDRNKDGVLTGKEAAKFGAQNLDKDEDGQISKEEFVKARERARLETQFKDYEGNGDNFLSGNEIQADVLAAKDANGDGRLDLPEWLGEVPEPQPEPVVAEEDPVVEEPVAEEPEEEEPVAEEPVAEPEQPASPVQEQPASPVQEQPAPPVQEQPAPPVEEPPPAPVAEQPVAPQPPAEPLLAPEVGGSDIPTEPVTMLQETYDAIFGAPSVG
ncbi:MAG: hypothetical protein VKP57_10785 [Candidatus Sericytochromatia bacterium]|nr:hypothetical protein [Candidatus Sericytochromatia bacterium]